MFHLKYVSYVCYPSKLFQNHDKYNPLFMLHLKECFFKRRVSKKSQTFNPKSSCICHVSNAENSGEWGYEVIVSIRSVVNFNPKRKISAQIASPPSNSWIFFHPSLSSFQATQSLSADTRAERFVSDRKGSSPHTVPATMVSIRFPCSRSYVALRMPLSSRYKAFDSSYH